MAAERLASRIRAENEAVPFVPICYLLPILCVCLCTRSNLETRAFGPPFDFLHRRNGGQSIKGITRSVDIDTQALHHIIGNHLFVKSILATLKTDRQSLEITALCNNQPCG